MATLYEDIPTLVDRIVAADLVVTGRIGRLLGIEPVRAGDQPRVFGLFEVSVERVIWGDQPSDPILMRVLGEGEDEGAAWVIPVGEHEPLALILARDVEPGLPDNVFAPYFASGFPVTEGLVRLPDELVEDLPVDITERRDSGISIEGFERLVREVEKSRQERDRDLGRVEPAELREQPYPEVAEMPLEVGGAQPAAPEGEPPQFLEAESPAPS